MRPAIRAALPKMGFNRNFPRELVFSTKEYQGLGVQHLFTLQSIEHLKNVIAHQLHPDLTTELHDGTFESLYLQIGLGKEFLNCALPGVDRELPRTIATCIQQFCYSYGVSIEHDIDVPLLREGDQFLMPLFQHPNFSDEERYIINKCRIYLRILTIAEMT